MVLPEREDPECAANRRRGCSPHFLCFPQGNSSCQAAAPTFLLSCQKKSRRRSGGKGNRLGMSWPPWANSPKTRGPPPRTAEKVRWPSTGCAIPIPPRTVSPHQKVRRTPMFQTGRPLPFFPLPLPRPTPGGVSKGEGPQPRPFVPEGVWGTVASPHVSGGGLRGRDLCAKGPFPLPCSGSYHLREQGKWNVPLWEQREYPLWLLVPETGTALCGSSLYLLNFCFSSYSRPIASMGVRVSGWQRRMASSTSPSLMASSET